MKSLPEKSIRIRHWVQKYLPKINRARGNTLLYIVLVMVIFGLLGATMVSLFTSSTVSTATLNEDRRVRYLYESACRYAMSVLRNNNFDSAEIDALNATTYTLDPPGTFEFDVYSLWFRSNETKTIPATLPTISARMEEGALPGGLSFPGGNVFAVNIESTDIDPVSGKTRIPDSTTTASRITVTGISGTAPNYTLSVIGGENFAVSEDERICLAVRPTSNQTLNAGDDLMVHENARYFFPRHGGAVFIDTDIVYYEEAIHYPGSRVELTNLSAAVTASSANYVILWPTNHTIIPTANTENVSYGGTAEYALNVVDTGDLTIGKYGSPKPDIDNPEFVKNLSEKESDSGFIAADDSTPGNERLIIGGTAGDAFGGAWYDADKSVGGVTNFCTEGICRFGLGIRAFFTLTKSGSGDGFIFTLLNGNNNTKDSIGGDTQAAELLGYAGDSRLVVSPPFPVNPADYLDGRGVGLLPPKIGLEFDTAVNFDGGQSYCSPPTPPTTNMKPDTRNDPLANDKDAVQYVFWGRTDSVPIPCRGSKAVYDDNRHDPAAFSEQKQWEGFINGKASLGRPAIGPNGHIYISNRTNVFGGYFVTAYRPNGTKEWDFPVGDDPEYNPGVDPNSGVIYSDLDSDRIVAIKPDGGEKWNLFIGADIPSGFVVGSDGTVYFGGNQPPSVPPLPAIPPGTSGTVYAVSDNGTNGSIKWQFPTNGDAVTTPALSPDESVVYAAGGASDTNLYAINTTTGAGEWTYSAPDAINGGPTVDPLDGTIYFGCDNNRVYAINPDGSFKWISGVITTYDVLSAPAVDPDNGAVYASSNDLGTGNDDRVYALDRATGNLKWQFITGNEIRSAPTVGADGTIYIGSDNDNLYAIDPNGNELWSFDEPADDVASSPVIGADGLIYFGADDSKIYALNPFTEPRNYRQNLVPPPLLPEQSHNLVAVNETPIASNPYPNGLAFMDPDDWLGEGIWAVRMEITRNTIPGDRGDYVLRTWIYQCQDTGGGTDCSDILGTFYENTRYGFEPANLEPLLVQSFSLPDSVLASSPDNKDFDFFLFGFTSATLAGDTQEITINNLQLSFIRPGDPVATADFPPP